MAFRLRIPKPVWEPATGTYRAREDTWGEHRPFAARQVEKKLRLRCKRSGRGMKRGPSDKLSVPLDGPGRVRALGPCMQARRSDLTPKAGKPIAYKAARVALTPKMPVARAFQIIANSCLRQFQLNASLVTAHRSAEPLHQARVAIRRLRSALSLFKSIVADRNLDRFKRDFRDLSHILGDARDLDVYVARSSPVSSEDRGHSSRELKRTRRVQSERVQAYQRVISALQSKRFRSLVHDFGIWILNGPWCTSNERKRAELNRSIPEFAAHVLTRRWRRFKHRGRHLDRLTSDEQHRIRIDSKKMRYASEFFSSLIKDLKHIRRHKTFVAALESLQTVLGDLNDVRSRPAISASRSRSEAARAKTSDAQRKAAAHRGASSKRLAALLSLAVEAHRKLIHSRPF